MRKTKNKMASFIDGELSLNFITKSLIGFHTIMFISMKGLRCSPDWFNKFDLVEKLLK